MSSPTRLTPIRSGVFGRGEPQGDASGADCSEMGAPFSQAVPEIPSLTTRTHQEGLGATRRSDESETPPQRPSQALLVSFSTGCRSRFNSKRFSPPQESNNFPPRAATTGVVQEPEAELFLVFKNVSPSERRSDVWWKRVPLVEGVTPVSLRERVECACG